MKKTTTIDLKGKAYATVPARIMEFRKDNLRGLIETSYQMDSINNTVAFKTRILKDKSDEYSAEATGHAIGKNQGEKAFEKLETISVGRALALLGYMASGDIASGEEMEEFEEYKTEKLQEVKDRLSKSKTQVELKEIFLSLGNDKINPEIIKLKDELKLKLK